MALWTDINYVIASKGKARLLPSLCGAERPRPEGIFSGSVRLVLWAGFPARLKAFIFLLYH